jgi:hypothetical protein
MGRREAADRPSGCGPERTGRPGSWSDLLDRRALIHDLTHMLLEQQPLASAEQVGSVLTPPLRGVGVVVVEKAKSKWSIHDEATLLNGAPEDRPEDGNERVARTGHNSKGAPSLGPPLPSGKGDRQADPSSTNLYRRFTEGRINDSDVQGGLTVELSCGPATPTRHTPDIVTPHLRPPRSGGPAAGAMG